MSKNSFKAIGLYSGGLDSVLAIRILLKASLVPLRIISVRFNTPFFNSLEEKQEKFQQESDYLKERFNIELKNFDITKDFLKILKRPKYGFGKHLNPCIDCRILMLKKAKEIMLQEKAEFIFTGEVIGQRPKSQRVDNLRVIEKESGLKGYLLRPLSAKLLDETIPEKQRIINRNKLYDITGRSRTIQLNLAKKFGIKYFTTPSGGCLLTDPEYSRKLSIIKSQCDLEKNNRILNFLGNGRIFIMKKNLLIIGRNDVENKKLLRIAGNTDLLIQPKKIPGPLCVFLKTSKASKYLTDEKNLNEIASICAKYTKSSTEYVNIQFGFKRKEMEQINKLTDLRLKNTLIIEKIKK